MQIVIEIPEERYNEIRTKNEHGQIFNAVKNGTPLPKGHGRLIEVTPRLECELFTFTRYTGIDEAPYEDATKIIDNAPTIIEADEEVGE